MHEHVHGSKGQLKLCTSIYRLNESSFSELCWEGPAPCLSPGSSPPELDLEGPSPWLEPPRRQTPTGLRLYPGDLAPVHAGRGGLKPDQGERSKVPAPEGVLDWEQHL